MEGKLLDNILLRANDIVFNRGEEKTRQYGDFIQSMIRMSKLSTEMCNKEITVEDCYKIMVALKLSRESHSHREDNLLDIIAYLASLNEYEKTKNNV